jgi:hypothetical protein
MPSFNFKLMLPLLLCSSTLCLAADPMLKRQEEFQKERLRVFNSLVGEKEVTKAPPPVQEKAVFLDSVAFPKGIRDPFAIPSILLQSLATERSKKERQLSASAYAFSNTSLLAVPKIKLKGVMHHPNNPSPLAILLLNGETYMVREGDEVGFNPSEPSQVIKIKKIKRLSVLIEVGTLGALVVVR